MDKFQMVNWKISSLGEFWEFMFLWKLNSEHEVRSSARSSAAEDDACFLCKLRPGALSSPGRPCHPTPLPRVTASS